MDKLSLIDYKDVRRLRTFVSERGKITPRRISGSCARNQRQLTRAVRRARTVALLGQSSVKVAERGTGQEKHFDGRRLRPWAVAVRSATSPTDTRGTSC